MVKYRKEMSSEYARLPISAQGFPISDWFLLTMLITHVTNVLKLASKMYPVKSNSEAKLGEQTLAL